MSSWADPWSSGHCDSRPIIQAWFWEQAHDHENRPMPQTWLYGNWWALIFRTKTLTSYFSSWTVMFDMILPFQQQEVEWWHPEWPFEDSRWRCVVVIVAEWLLFPHWASTVLNTSDTLWSCWDCDLSDEMVWECNLKRQKQQTPVFVVVFVLFFVCLFFNAVFGKDGSIETDALNRRGLAGVVIYQLTWFWKTT